MTAVDLKKESEASKSQKMVNDKPFVSNLPPPPQVSDLTATEVLKFKHHADNEKATHYRLSNYAISTLLQMTPNSWRVFSSISEVLDVYPLELIEDEDFLAKFAEGKATIPEQFRTVKVRALDYQKRWKIPAQNAYRTFTLEALELFDETLANTFFNPKKGEAEINLSRPISDIRFHVNIKEKDGSSVAKEVTEKLIKRDVSDKRDGLLWQCHAVTFVLHERLAYQMFLMQRMFTRIEKSVTGKLSKPALKIFTMLCMFANSTPARNGAWLVQLDLDQCNAMAGTNSETIARFSANFKRYAKELTERTEFDIEFSKDKQSKIGQKFTKLNIFFSRNEKRALSIAVKDKSVTRKLVPRPRVLAGSHAEGEWAKKNISILLKYEKELKAIKRILPKVDRERLARYKKIVGMQ